MNGVKTQWIWAGVACWLGACGAVDLDRQDWQAQVRSAFVDQPSVWPADASASCSGLLQVGSSVAFELRRTAATPGAPDELWRIALFAPSTAEPSGTRLTIRSTGASTVMALKEHAVADVFEGELSVARDGDEPETAPALFALAALQAGLAASCEAMQALKPDAQPTPAEQRTLILSLAASVALSTLANQNAAARGLAIELVQMPSWWTWLVPRLDMALIQDLLRAERLDFLGRPAWGIPVELRIKGDPAFYAWIVAVQPEGVLSMTAGIVQVVGFAPDRPAQIVRVDLVEADPGHGKPVRSALHWKPAE